MGFSQALTWKCFRTIARTYNYHYGFWVISIENFTFKLSASPAIFQNGIITNNFDLQCVYISERRYSLPYY